MNTQCARTYIDFRQMILELFLPVKALASLKTQRVGACCFRLRFGGGGVGLAALEGVAAAAFRRRSTLELLASLCCSGFGASAAGAATASFLRLSASCSFGCTFARAAATPADPLSPLSKRKARCCSLGAAHMRPRFAETAPPPFLNDDAAAALTSAVLLPPAVPAAVLVAILSFLHLPPPQRHVRVFEAGHMRLPHLASPQQHCGRCIPVVRHRPLPHLASPQLHFRLTFPVVAHRALPHLASPQLHVGRTFPVVGHGRDGIKCCTPTSIEAADEWASLRRRRIHPGCG